MSRHPAPKGAQRRAFDEIAAGDPCPPMHPATRDALLKAGLIARGPDRILGRDVLGAITLPTYYVPLPLHVQWCEWCAEQDSGE